MKKIPFDIKYRPEIEAGKYKVILDCGVEAEILAWDKPGVYPIVCMAKKEGSIPFRTDNTGIAYHYPEGSNYSDLYIITTEPELSAFEQAVIDYKYGGHDSSLFDPGYFDKARNEAAELLDLAKKELCESGEVTDWYAKGKAEALKDLPRWRKWGNGACGNGKQEPIAIIRYPGGSFSLTSCLGVDGEEYIMLEDLNKLPKE